MKKKIMIGAVVPLVVALGMWFAVGSAAAAHTTNTAPAQHQTTVLTKTARATTARATTQSETQGGGESETQGGAESETQGGTESEGGADAAAQHADCLTAGIDDTVTPNVQYDDQTGACTLDTGTDNEGGS